MKTKPSYQDLRGKVVQLTAANEALTSQCESLERSESMALTDLRKVKAVAEYWKARAEASEKLMQDLNS